MKFRARLPLLLLVIHWLLFLLAFGWTCKIQHNVLWWLRLDWTGWPAELSELSELGTLSAGTFWILWLASTLMLTCVWLLYPRQKPQAVVTEPSVDAARKQLVTNSSMMESDPVLKEKLLRLHQSLDKI